MLSDGKSVLENRNFLFFNFTKKRFIHIHSTWSKVFGISMCVVRADEDDEDREGLEEVRLASSRRNYFHKTTTTTTAPPGTVDDFRNNLEQVSDFEDNSNSSLNFKLTISCMKFFA